MEEGRLEEPEELDHDVAIAEKSVGGSVEKLQRQEIVQELPKSTLWQYRS